jgi:hypothetical protein
LRWELVLLAFLSAPVAHADNSELLAFMGGQGCTIGADSRAAADRAGFGADQIDALVGTAVANGKAVQQGRYVVLGEDICTIRLPDIKSIYTVASPEIVAITSAIDAYAADGERGCFLGDAPLVFDGLHGGRDHLRRSAVLLSFCAAHASRIPERQRAMRFDNGYRCDPSQPYRAYHRFRGICSRFGG